MTRERLSSRGTFVYRTIDPFVVLAITAVGFGTMAWGGWTKRDAATLTLVAFIPLFFVVVYMAWRCRSLCDVWLAGDTLEVKNRERQTRIPLASVHLIDGGSAWNRPRVAVLWLDRPVDGVREVRFIPRGSQFGWPEQALSGIDTPDDLIADLRARVARARSPAAPP